MKFRKKPLMIEAIQWNGANGTEIAEWAGNNISFPSPNGNMPVHTLEGTLYASVGDWIIKGIKEEFYPCKPDIFEQIYEPI